MGHKINVYAPDGSPLYSASAHVPNTDWADIQNAAMDTDGTLVGAAEYYKAKTIAGGGIVLFDRSGTQTAFFDTGEYLPTQVAFAPAHSIWVLGWKNCAETARSATISSCGTTRRTDRS